MCLSVCLSVSLSLSLSFAYDTPLLVLKYCYPHAFLKSEGDIVIASVRLSVRPSVRLSVRLLCYLLLNHWTKFNQIWCVSYLHKWGAQRHFVFGPAPWGPGEGSKGQISFNFNYKVNIFIPNFVCVLTNESYKTYQMGFLFCRLRHALGVGLGDT